MVRKLNAWCASWLLSAGYSLILFGVIAIPNSGQADTGPPCNEGGDPSMPKGCVGTCDSPKTCEIHPIQLVCKCR
jgi:hypothetical protein